MRPACCSGTYVIIMITSPLGPTVAPQVMFGLFTACTAAYGYYLWRHKKVVHKVHMLMMALIFFKVWTVLSQALMYHYIEATGSADGWNIAYYVFTFFRGILFFTVVVLIGTGEGGRSWRVGGLSHLVGCQGYGDCFGLGGTLVISSRLLPPVRAKGTLLASRHTHTSCTAWSHHVWIAQ